MRDGVTLATLSLLTDCQVRSYVRRHHDAEGVAGVSGGGGGVSVGLGAGGRTEGPFQ